MRASFDHGGYRSGIKKPPEVRKLEGNPGKRRIPEPVVRATGKIFEAKHLTADAKACIEVIRNSLPIKTFAALDSFLLTSFAEAWSLHKAAVIAIQAEGHISEGSTGQPVVNPWIKVLNEQARIMLALSGKLYLDPVSRLAIRTDEQPKSKFSDL